MDNTSAPLHTDPRHTDPPLQAVSLQDYEQLVTVRASFVDFLLRRPEAA